MHEHGRRAGPGLSVCLWEKMLRSSLHSQPGVSVSPAFRLSGNTQGRTKRGAISQVSKTERQAGQPEQAGMGLCEGCAGQRLQGSTWGPGAGVAWLSGACGQWPAPVVAGVAGAGSWAGGGALTMTEAGTERWGPSVERGCRLLS